MKKRYIAPLVAAVLFSAPLAQAGFSSKPSSSSSKPAAVSKPATPTPKPAAPAAAPAKPSNYGSLSGFGSAKKEEPKRDYSYSAKPAQAPRAIARNEPLPPVATPKQAVQVSPTQVSGFSAAPKDKQAQSGTVGKKVAGVAAATALGGALYAAGANHEAVAAYEAPTHKAESTESAKASESAKLAQAESVKTEKATVTPAKPVQETPATTRAPVSQQPQVVVIQQEEPRYRHDSHDDAYWYQRGKENAYREQAQAGGTYSMPAPSVTTQPTQGAPAVDVPTMQPGSLMGLLLVILALAVLVWAVFFWANRSQPKASKPTPRKSNYTL